MLFLDELLYFSAHIGKKIKRFCIFALQNSTDMPCSLHHILLLPALIFFAACSYNQQVDESIGRALEVMEDRPDLSLEILDSIKTTEGDWSTPQRMYFELVYAQAQNKAYIPFTSDSIVLEVAEYYSWHGSGNEQMMANYLVGCAYRDLGDAPAALKFLKQAVEAADTTAEDCDFATLMRVHSQMGGLYQDVLALDDEKQEDMLAEQIAWHIRDTLSAVHLMWLRACGLYDSQQYEQAIQLLNRIEAIGNRTRSADFLAMAYPIQIENHIRLGEAAKAYSLLCRFEKQLRESDYGIYHRLMGMYYNLTNQPDSSIVQFQLFIKNTDDNHQDRNQLMSREEYYRGLQEAYTSMHQPDSAIKYARLYCQLNDSTTRIHSSEQLLRMQSLYNYSKAQEEAFESEQKAIRWFTILVLTILSAAFAMFAVWRIYTRRLEKEKQKQIMKNVEYMNLLQGFEKSSQELQLFKHDTAQFRKEKEEEIQKLRKALSLYQADKLELEDWNEERSTLGCEVAGHLHSISSRGQKATESELYSLMQIAQRVFPLFYAKVTDASFGLSEKEVAISTLIRFRFISSEIAVLTGLSPQRITNIKSTINKKLFGKQGAKTLEAKLVGLK